MCCHLGGWGPSGAGEWCQGGLYCRAQVEAGNRSHKMRVSVEGSPQNDERTSLLYYFPQKNIWIPHYITQIFYIFGVRILLIERKLLNLHHLFKSYKILIWEDGKKINSVKFVTGLPLLDNLNVEVKEKFLNTNFSQLLGFKVQYPIESLTCCPPAYTTCLYFFFLSQIFCFCPIQKTTIKVKNSIYI